MKPVPLRLLAVALLAMSTPARAAPNPDARAVLARAEAALADRSPASTAILDDRAFLAALQAADPIEAHQLVAEKLLIRDLVWLTAHYKDVRQLRRALLSRSGEKFDEAWARMELGPDPDLLVSWVRIYRDEETGKAFAQAVRSWNVLSAASRESLARRGIDQVAWSAQTLPQRETTLKTAAASDAQDILATPLPWTDEQLEDFNKRVDALLVSVSRADEIHDAIMRVSVIGGLRYFKNGKVPAGGQDLLRRAQDASLPLGQRLQALNALYDLQRGVAPRPDLPLSVPAKTYTPLSDEQRDALAKKLETALPAVLDPDLAKQTLDHYKDHPLTIDIAELGDTRVAQFEPSTSRIVLDLRTMRLWSDDEGIPLAKLLADDKALRLFARDFAPLFVHESTHYRRAQTASIHNQIFEIEAMFDETWYANELAKKDPDYAARLKAKNPYGRLNSDLIAAFGHGRRYFEQKIAAYHYCEYPSLHGTTLMRANGLESLAEFIERKIPDGTPKPTKERIEKAYRQRFHETKPEVLTAAVADDAPEDAAAVVAGIRQDELHVLGVYDQLRDDYWKQLTGYMDEYWEKEHAPGP